MPAQPVITYQLYDLVSGKYLGHLPLNSVTFSSTLNGAGSFQGQVDIASQAVQNLGPISATQPARTALMIDYDGALVWGGVIWPRNYQFNPQTRILTVSATELWSWMAQRVQATDYSAPPNSGLTGPSATMPIWDAASSGSTWDSVLMAWQILADCLAATIPGVSALMPGQILGGMGILANGFTTASAYLASGTQTPAADYLNLTAPYTSLQNMGTIITQLAGNGLGVGFDFGIDVAYSRGPGSAPVATLNLSYPFRGRSQAQNRLVVNSGNAITYEPPEDGSQAADVIYEQGSNGALVIAFNQDMLEAGWPMLEKVISRSNLTSANVLQLLESLAASDIITYSFPVVTPSVTVDLFGANPALGSFVVGDQIRWMIPETNGAGEMYDPRFPTGLDQIWRISGYNATVADEGTSTLQLQLVQPPSITTPVGPPI